MVGKITNLNNLYALAQTHDRVKDWLDSWLLIHDYSSLDDLDDEGSTKLVNDFQRFLKLWGSRLGISSPSPTTHPTLTPSTGSCQTSLGVYVHISPSDLGGSIDDASFNDDHRPIHYLKYRSIMSRFEYHDYEELHTLTLDLKKIRSTIRWINKRLTKEWIPNDERQKLRASLSMYVKFSQKLVNDLSRRLPIYADRFFVEVPEGYAELLKYLGYPSDTLYLSVWLSKGTLELSFDGGSSSELPFAYLSKVHAGKFHPAKGIHKGSKEAKRVLKDLLLLSEFLEGLLFSYRKGDHVTTHNLLPVRHYVLTAPKELSQFIWERLKNGDDSLLKLFKKVSAQTMKDFLIYLAKKEKVEGDLLPAFTLNIHPTGDLNPFEPHFHADIIAVHVVYDKAQNKWFRLNPLLNEDDLHFLRTLWKKHLLNSFSSFIFEDTKLKDFNIWAGDQYYSVPIDKVSILFVLRYASRKMFVNFANFFENNEFDPSLISDPAFVKFLFEYENRLERYGFLKNTRSYLSKLSSEVVDVKIKEIKALLDVAESDLILNSDAMSETLRQSLEAKVKALRDELNHLENEGFDYLYKKTEEKVQKMLSNENLTQERIINILDTLFEAQGKRIVGYQFNIEEENVPLYEFLNELDDSDLSPVLLSDRHKSLKFIWLGRGET